MFVDAFQALCFQEIADTRQAELRALRWEAILKAQELMPDAVLCVVERKELGWQTHSIQVYRSVSLSCMYNYTTTTRYYIHI